VDTEASRLRPLFPIGDDPAFETAAQHEALDVAARYSHTLGDWDLAVSGFNGTSREPNFIPNRNNTNLQPYYERISQAGLEAQYTTGPWLWKLEGIVREGQGKTFAAAVGGFEYTAYQLFDTQTDLGLIAEYLYDDRDSRAPVTPFDNDLFVGTRLGFNDTQDTSLLVGGIIDLETGSTSLRLEGQRRLGQDFQLEIAAQFFSNIDGADPLASFERDSHLTFRITRYY
jgi:hypothetical protein